MFKGRNQVAGLSLVELLIAISISFLIVDALITMYLSAEKNRAWQASLNSIGENAQLAVQLLRQDIQSAGNIGCAQLTADFPLSNHTSYIFDQGNKISGDDSTVTVRHASVKSASLLEPMTDYSSLTISGNIAFKAEEIAIISDCAHAEIFTIQKVSGSKKSQKIFSLQALNYLYAKNAEISPLEINTYYIQDSGRKSQNGKPISALYFKNISQRKSELVEGINALQFNYDVEQAGEVITMHASQINDWSKVIGVRIALTMVSPDDLALQKPWFSYAAAL